MNALGDRLEMSVYLKEGLTEHEKDFSSPGSRPSRA